MRSGYMYMMPLDSGLYALVPTRCWYAPWLWDVYAYQIKGRYVDDRQPIASKVRRDEAYSLMKILGATNLEN
jgi:hypothetical protein